MLLRGIPKDRAKTMVLGEDIEIELLAMGIEAGDLVVLRGGFTQRALGDLGWYLKDVFPQACVVILPASCQIDHCTRDDLKRWGLIEAFPRMRQS